MPIYNSLDHQSTEDLMALATDSIYGVNKKSDIDSLGKLLNAGLDPNISLSGLPGSDLLRISCQLARPDAVEFLIENGAIPTSAHASYIIRNSNKDNQEAKVGILKMLLKNGVSPADPINNRETLIEFAKRLGDKPSLIMMKRFISSKDPKLVEELEMDVLTFENFIAVSEYRHFDPMKDERVSTRSGRRSYIEKQLNTLGYNYVIDIKPEDTSDVKNAAKGTPEPETPPQKPAKVNADDNIDTQPKRDELSDITIGEYGMFGAFRRSRNRPKIKIDKDEFAKFCQDFFGMTPEDMDPELRSYAMEDFRFEKELDAIYGGEYYRMPFVMDFSSRSSMTENIVVFANGFDPQKPTRVLMAHYDVNTESDAHDNANDNGASIIVLLEYLEDKKFPAHSNVLVVFTDGEEFGGQGAKSFADQIKDGIHGDVQWVLNLDVVGIGDKVIFEDISKNSKIRGHIESVLGDDAGFIKMPFNDADKLRSKSIDAICLSVIPSENWDPDQKRLKGSPTMWMNLHKKTDTWGSISKESIQLAYDTVSKLMNA